MTCKKIVCSNLVPVSWHNISNVKTCHKCNRYFAGESRNIWIILIKSQLLFNGHSRFGWLTWMHRYTWAQRIVSETSRKWKCSCTVWLKWNRQSGTIKDLPIWVWRHCLARQRSVWWSRAQPCSCRGNGSQKCSAFPWSELKHVFWGIIKIKKPYCQAN